MTIRFQCVSCRQPIEVDDEWASKAVACPYCRKTITAPAESSLGELYEIPQARALENGGPGLEPVSPDRPWPADDASGLALKQPNRLAIASLILVFLFFALYVAANAVVAPHMSEMGDSFKPDASFSEQNEALTKLIEANDGNFPGWMIGMLVLIGLSGAAWFAALVCGIIAVSRPAGRRMSIAALVLCGVFPLFICCFAAVGLG